MTSVLPTNTCVALCEAFLALADLVDPLVVIPLGCVEPNQIRECVRTMLRKCEAAGLADYMIPKFHWATHYARNLKR